MVESFEMLNSLLGTVVVADDAYALTKSDYDLAENRLFGALEEVDKYVRGLMSDEEDYYLSIVIPDGRLVIESGCILDRIHFPFMSISKNVLDALQTEPDNPVYKLLMFFSAVTSNIDILLFQAGYSYVIPPDDELIRQAGIRDLLNAHAYKLIYQDVAKYLHVGV